MLYIHWGELDNEIYGVKGLFDTMLRDFPEWLEDDFVKEMIKGVDKVTVHSPYNLESPVFGSINTTMLSDGVKALILMYKTDYIINASNCGDNCACWILKIAEKKKLTITLHNIMGFKTDFKAKILNDNKYIKTYLQYVKSGINHL